MAAETEKPETKKSEAPKQTRASASTFDLTGGVYRETPAGEGVEFKTPAGESLFIRFGGNHALQDAYREFSKGQK